MSYVQCFASDDAQSLACKQFQEVHFIPAGLRRGAIAAAAAVWLSAMPLSAVADVPVRMSSTNPMLDLPDQVELPSFAIVANQRRRLLVVHSTLRDGMVLL